MTAQRTNQTNHLRDYCRPVKRPFLAIRLAPLILALFCTSAVAIGAVVPREQVTAGAPIDGPSPSLFEDGFEITCPIAGCGAGQVCRFDVCIPEPQACVSTDDCPGDTYCETLAGECLPWGLGPGGLNDEMCGADFPQGAHFPTTQCEWTGPAPGDPFPGHVNVISTPVVADFTQAGPDGPVRPWIVFTTYNCLDGGLDACAGNDPECTAVIRVIDGRTCEPVTNISTPAPIASTTPALGDLDNDGVPEIVAARVGGGLAAWKLGAGPAFSLLWETVSTFGAGSCNWTGPSIHDLDDSGAPEVLLHGGVFSASGAELDTAVSGNENLTIGYVPVIADIDALGQPELVTGTASYRWEDEWVLLSALGVVGANIAVADFGTYGVNPAADDRGALDGIGEVVAVNQGNAVFRNHLGRLLATVAIPSGGNGGPPAVGDFDGDGRAEVAVSGATTFSVFDLDCSGTPDPDYCAAESTDYVLWQSPVQDLSSSRTGAVVFDFDGDGAAEPVFADECFTRIYDGVGGDVLYSRARNSCTFFDRPTIADVDADFRAEIVVPSNLNCGVMCPAIDPVYDGPRCDTDADCTGATECRREQPGDPWGQCRCEVQVDCGDGFACVDPIAGPSAQGKVCRAAHPGGAGVAALQIIDDPLQRWAQTRTIWNQDAYAITHVGDLGDIPAAGEWEINWQQAGLNDFRANRDSGAGSLPDLTLRGGRFACTQSGVAEIEFEICNRGARAVTDGLGVAVRDGQSTACEALTPRLILPGTCITAGCTWNGAPTGAPVPLSANVDDDGIGATAVRECRENNNELTITDVVCP